MTFQTERRVSVKLHSVSSLGLRCLAALSLQGGPDGPTYSVITASRLCRRDLVPALWVPSFSNRELRERVNRRADLIRLRTAAKKSRVRGAEPVGAAYPAAGAPLRRSDALLERARAPWRCGGARWPRRSLLWTFSTGASPPPASSPPCSGAIHIGHPARSLVGSVRRTDDELAPLWPESFPAPLHPSRREPSVGRRPTSASPVRRSRAAGTVNSLVRAISAR